MKKQNFRLTVFFGDVFENVAIQALQSDNSAFLLNFNNCVEFLNNELRKDTTIYTSIGDLNGNVSQLWQLLNLADAVVYCPPTVWSDGKTVDVFSPTESTQGYSEHWLLMLPQNKVFNFDRSRLSTNPVPLVDRRRSEEPQLWVAGCSITHGMGVDSSQRYGQLVADELNIPCSFLTRIGSAIDWASDQIIRSDIRTGDTVIWGLTSANRLTYIHNQKLLEGINANSYIFNNQLEKIVSASTLLSQNTFYHHMYSIDRVINFCNIIKVKLIIVGLLTTDSCLRHLSNTPSFYPYNYLPSVTDDESKFVNFHNYADLGTDFQHPGPIQHSLYKDFILSII